MSENNYLQSIFYKRGQLQLIDQTVLPHRRELVQINNVEDAWRAIREMRVRGAPAIAVVACLSVAVELANRAELTTVEALAQYLRSAFEHLRTSRPTAVNLCNLTEQCYGQFEKLVAAGASEQVSSLKEAYLKYIEALYDDDVDRNQRIGEHGAEEFLRRSGAAQSVRVLTHCNTGSLATCGYGTALGVVRRLHQRGRLAHVFFTETRPYFQGARLTAFELQEERIPSTMICDNMVGMLLSRAVTCEASSNDALAFLRAKGGQRNGDKTDFFAVVGADRIAANGDTANKIGTLNIAICAAHYGVPFYVAAPISTVDLRTSCGQDIVIEERAADEMTQIGAVRVAANGISVWNPAFDVTPSRLIAGIITEYGVFSTSELADRVRELRQREAIDSVN